MTPFRNRCAKRPETRAERVDFILLLLSTRPARPDRGFAAIARAIPVRRTVAYGFFGTRVVRRAVFGQTAWDPVGVDSRAAPRRILGAAAPPDDAPNRQSIARCASSSTATSRSPQGLRRSCALDRVARNLRQRRPTRPIPHPPLSKNFGET
jgi:hypothetical protein